MYKYTYIFFFGCQHWRFIYFLFLIFRISVAHISLGIFYFRQNLRGKVLFPHLFHSLSEESWLCFRPLPSSSSLSLSSSSTSSSWLLLLLLLLLVVLVLLLIFLLFSYFGFGFDFDLASVFLYVRPTDVHFARIHFS